MHRKHSARNIYKELKTAKMKVFLMLAIVAFAGCHAKQPTDAFWDYIRYYRLRDIINEYADTLQKQKDLTTVRDKLEPYAEDLKTQIQQRVEELRVILGSYAETLDSEALKTNLLQKTEELRGSLEEKVKELQSQLVPYTDLLRQKLDQHVQDFQKAVTPLTEDLQRCLAPHAEDLRKKLDPYIQNLKDHFTSLYESFTKTD
ncbi:hypothetical protein AMELA_G00083510 [Ameiurus melas]|uniref:Apolipoprotein A-IV n=1 Tax=Ameiurus melas TaxID=219545 RepID=A0A7J6AZZ8_AMEME|nr:hypothetical protein AMELA_G00083510 [Ameiurus melas]